MKASKILVIRFSSIGDIVLTTPVLRCLHEQNPNMEIHVVCKHAFAPVLSSNPNVTKLHTFKKDIREVFPVLEAEQFSLIIDLHNNLRSLRLKRQLRVKSYSFNKLNLRKMLAVWLKMRWLLPPVHIVQRYFAATASLGIKDDGKGLDYFIPKEDEVNLSEFFGEIPEPKFIVLVVGGSYFTKKIPHNKLSEIVENARLPIVLLGGPEDKETAEQLMQKHPALINGVGKFSLNQSASVIKQSGYVITSDTGMMHIAAAFNKIIFSVWGNTIPAFGMGPYLPRPESRILEVNDLPCRPCSKLGYGQCPLGHFKCMQEIDYRFLKDIH